VTRKPLFTAPPAGSDEKAKPFGPTNVAVDQKGQIYVSNSRGFTIKIYSCHSGNVAGKNIQPEFNKFSGHPVLTRAGDKKVTRIYSDMVGYGRMQGFWGRNRLQKLFFESL